MNIKKQIIDFSRQLYQQGYLTSLDGNVSHRLDENHFWITPSKIPKQKLNELDLVLVNSQGVIVEGRHQASSELPMHLEAYRQRNDINAVIHAHPRHVTACTLADIPLNRCVLPEIILALGSIPTAEYATPCTGEGAQVISHLITKFNAIALARHGSITVGTSLLQAFTYLEKMEQLAQILLQSQAHQNALPLNEIEKILGVCGKNRTHLDCSHCNTCPL